LDIQAIALCRQPARCQPKPYRLLRLTLTPKQSPVKEFDSLVSMRLVAECWMSLEGISLKNLQGWLL
jgi:hypothetical protein